MSEAGGIAKAGAAPTPIPARAVFVLCGAALLAGFFMPWFKLGNLLQVSGMGLVFTQGEAVGMLSGANRFLLVAVPLLGALLVLGGALGWRVTFWIAVIGASIILLYGLFTVMGLFISSTGLGMWLVIVASIGSLGIGLFGVGRRAAE
ncbi:MAG TPA: hypothetical protein VGK73_38310 [Polyangiaceae bacterium]